MSSSPQSQTRTRMFARVMGPFITLIAAVTVTRSSDMRTLVTDFGANTVWPWVTGSFILLGGVSIIAFHQYWRGAAAIIVSVLGWLLVVRGLFLLLFPDTFMSLANNIIGVTAVWVTAAVVMAVIGLYLTYVGWVAAPQRPASQGPRSTKDLPRAA